MPVKLVSGEGYVPCSADEATHVTLIIPGPSGRITLPVIQHGTRAGTGCWTWNGSTEAPTLRPSVLTTGRNFLGGEPTDKANWPEFRCHTWINDGKAQFLDDCSHEHRGKTLDLLEASA